jgi:hypothetical protein
MQAPRRIISMAPLILNFGAGRRRIQMNKKSTNTLDLRFPWQLIRTIPLLGGDAVRSVIKFLAINLLRNPEDRDSSHFHQNNDLPSKTKRRHNSEGHILQIYFKKKSF